MVNHEDVTRRLLDEGARIIAEQGPAGLSMRKLAAAVGTSTMAVYTRFGDKDRLLRAMYSDGFGRLGEGLSAVSRDSAESLLDLGRAYRSFALENRHLYGLMFGPVPPDFEPSADNIMTAEATYQALVDAVVVAVEHAIFVGDPARIARHLWTVVHGMVSLELSGKLPANSTDPSKVFDDALVLAALPFLVPTSED